jgi:DNA processing protein
VELRGQDLEAAVHLVALGVPGRWLRDLLGAGVSPAGALSRLEAGERPRPLPGEAAAVRRARGARPVPEAVAGRVASSLAAIQRLDVRVVTYGGASYPARLGQLHDPPPIVFLRGDPELMDARTVAVVGARRHTEYGAEVTRAVSRDLAAAGVVVVSGMARGIDGIAHAAALDAGGTTIAVLGAGIDVPYPAEHDRLQERVAADGLLVSEFAPGEPALRYHFPRRNRILAALAEAVVVVEAGPRSGALITVEHALDLSREVFAVPGPIGRETSEGTNALIRDGAHMVTRSADILDVLRMPRSTPPPQGRGAPAEPWRDEGVAADAVAPVLDDRDPARALLGLLGDEPLHVDEVGRRAGAPPGTALASLLALELRGEVRQWPGMRFSRPSRSRNRGAAAG